MTTPESPVLTIQQAAAYLNTNPRHVQRLRQEHRLPVVKIGGLLRFLLSDLDAFIAAHREPSVGGS